MSGKENFDVGLTEIYDRVGHVIEWESGSIRKIFNGHKNNHSGLISWNHMPCKKIGDRYVIQGPVYTECGAICYYWLTEERAKDCRVLSVEEITEEDKREMAKPPGPPCPTCAERLEDQV